MERFKINPLSKNGTPIYRHSRRKSDQVSIKDSHISLVPHVSSIGIQNASKAFYRASILIRNPSIRSHSNDIKKKISLDLSKIRVNKNSGNLNFSARTTDYHQKFSHLYQRKLPNDKVVSNPCTERFYKREIEAEKEAIKENVKPIRKSKDLAVLEPSPEVDLICSNRFCERLAATEEKLSKFYSRKN